MQDSQREFEGADLAQALHQAAERLGIPEPDLDYKIIEQGRRGLFGIGAKNVRIRVMPPLDEELPDPNKRGREARPRRERNRRPRDRAAEPAADAPPAAKQDQPAAADGGGNAPDAATPRRRKSRNRRRRDRSRRERTAAPGDGEARQLKEKEGAPAAPPAAARSREGDGSTKREGSRRRSRSRSRSRSRRSSREETPRRSEGPPVPADPEQVAAVQATLQEMVDRIGLEIQSSPDDGGNGVRLDLDGSDRKLLLENDAELLGALQFVLNRMSRRAWPGLGRIQLSCNGQRTRRDDELVGLVQGAIEELKRSGQPQQLREMNAYERRLVHITVRQREGIDSSSEGDGHLKCVSIFKVESSAGAGDEVEQTEETEQIDNDRDAGELGDDQA